MAAFGRPAHAQDDDEEPSYVPMVETTDSSAMSNDEACIEALGYVGCDNLGSRAQQPSILWLSIGRHWPSHPLA